MSAAPAPLSLEQQADFLFYIINRCTMREGAVAGETWMLMKSQEVAELRNIEARLRRMVPHEAAIRRVVTGR